MSLADRATPLSIEKVGAGDTARAETTLPLAAAEVFAFVCAVECLVRLNPQLAIQRWLPAEWGFRFAGHNESNDRAFDMAARVDIAPEHQTLTLHYDTGLKQATEISIEPLPEGARIVVTEYYPRIDDPDDPRIAEVDKSLVPWVAALRRHLLARRRWSRLPLIFPLWRWWAERFMLALPLRQRRIVRLLIWTTVFEFVVFLWVVVVLRFAS